jgi:hypothetical protein
MAVRQMVQDMFEALMFDHSLRMAMIVDYGLGINGSKFHSALQSAVRAGATAEELDAVLGDGKAISALVKRYTEIDLAFETPYDTF